MTLTQIRLAGFAAAFSLVAVAATTLHAAPEPSAAGAVQIRKDGYKAIGQNFKKINDTLKGGGALNAELTTAAETIAEKATHQSEWFAPGTGTESGAETAAKSEIWSKPTEFAAKREAFVTESAKLAAVAKAGDAAGFAAQVPKVGGACKGCHDDFKTAKK